MQSSSPLAAMHRPSVTHMFERSSLGSHCSSDKGSNPIAGSMRHRQIQRAAHLFGADIRGSSPAASLCADISQNLGIDNEASPRFPTPRRALFSGAFQRKAAAELSVTTSSPGLDSSPMAAPDSSSPMSAPDSSPMSPGDVMVTSPKRQQQPQKFSFLKKVDEVPSPVHSDMDDDDDEMMVDTPVPMSRHSSAAVEPLRPTDRNRRIFPRQPSLSRSRPSLFGGNSRNLTENLIAHRLKPESRLAAFKPSTMSIGECFEAASPPAATSVRLGSPAPNHIRRGSNPLLRARKTMRRSLSMFEHPAEVMKPKVDEVATGPVPTVTLTSAAPGAAAQPEAAQEPSLPHFRADDPTDSIPRISKATLLEVLDGKYSQCFEQKMIIDCRFEYEYDGGHIDGAVNYNDKELLAKQLFQTPMNGRTLLVFHCEYSAHRAPLMARHVRSEDRTANAEHYPRLTYPEVYILDGGYSGFFAEHRGRCSPQQYIEMSDERHQRTCEREMGRLKARKAFGRAQTFAGFGERQRCVRELPTIKEPPRRFTKGASLFAAPKSSIPEIPSSPPRLAPRLDPVAMIGNSPILGERQSSRRMASY